jgi:hypothetical protein
MMDKDNHQNDNIHHKKEKQTKSKTVDSDKHQTIKSFKKWKAK